MKFFITIFIVLVFTKIAVFEYSGKTPANRENQKVLFQNSNNPIKIKFLHQKRGKPPLTFNNFKLSITNQFDSLRWYLFPTNLNDSLIANGQFKANTPWHTGYISGRKFPDALTKKHVIDVAFFGINSFIAICLPPKSSIEIEDYVLESWGDTLFSQMECWEVHSLMVNGKTPFNKWLPYNVLCSPNTHLKLYPESKVDWQNLNWNSKANASRTDYPKESIAYIQATGIKKIQVKFE